MQYFVLNIFQLLCQDFQSGVFLSNLKRMEFFQNIYIEPTFHKSVQLL